MLFITLASIFTFPCGVKNFFGSGGFSRSVVYHFKIRKMIGPSYRFTPNAVYVFRYVAAAVKHYKRGGLFCKGSKKPAVPYR